MLPHALWTRQKRASVTVSVQRMSGFSALADLALLLTEPRHWPRRWLYSIFPGLDFGTADPLTTEIPICSVARDPFMLNR